MILNGRNRDCAFHARCGVQSQNAAIGDCLATGLSIFGVGFGMYLADWHPFIGVALMAVGVAYLLWEFLVWGPISKTIPGMFRFLSGVIVACIIVGLSGPGIKAKLYRAPATSAASENVAATTAPPSGPATSGAGVIDGSDKKRAGQAASVHIAEPDRSKDHLPQPAAKREVISKTGTPEHSANDDNDLLSPKEPPTEFENALPQQLKEQAKLISNKIRDLVQEWTLAEDELHNRYYEQQLHAPETGIDVQESNSREQQGVVVLAKSFRRKSRDTIAQANKLRLELVHRQPCRDDASNAKTLHFAPIFSQATRGAEYGTTELSEMADYLDELVTKLDSKSACE